MTHGQTEATILAMLAQDGPMTLEEMALPAGDELGGTVAAMVARGDLIEYVDDPDDDSEALYVPVPPVVRTAYEAAGAQVLEIEHEPPKRLRVTGLREGRESVLYLSRIAGTERWWVVAAEGDLDDGGAWQAVQAELTRLQPDAD